MFMYMATLVLLNILRVHLIFYRVSGHLWLPLRRGVHGGAHFESACRRFPETPIPLA